MALVGVPTAVVVPVPVPVPVPVGGSSCVGEWPPLLALEGVAVALLACEVLMCKAGGGVLRAWVADFWKRGSAGVCAGVNVICPDWPRRPEGARDTVLWGAWMLKRD